MVAYSNELPRLHCVAGLIKQDLQTSSDSACVAGACFSAGQAFLY